MTSLDRLAADNGIAVEELTVWVERHWVLPSRAGSEFFFTEADHARVRMIAEFRNDLAIEEEAMPIVLDLVDRLHAAHAHLRVMAQALADLPPEERAALLRRLNGDAT